MKYGRLFDSGDTPANQALGVGAHVSYQHDELNELLHALRFLKTYKEENRLANEDMPRIIGGMVNFAIDTALDAGEHAAEMDEGIGDTPIDIQFYHVHVRVFRSYLWHLQHDKGVAGKEKQRMFEAYEKLEKSYFPKPEWTH